MNCESLNGWGQPAGRTIPQGHHYRLPPKFYWHFEYKTYRTVARRSNVKWKIGYCNHQKSIVFFAIEMIDLEKFTADHLCVHHLKSCSKFKSKFVLPFQPLPIQTMKIDLWRAFYRQPKFNFKLLWTLSNEKQQFCHVFINDAHIIACSRLPLPPQCFIHTALLLPSHPPTSSAITKHAQHIEWDVHILSKHTKWCVFIYLYTNFDIEWLLEWVECCYTRNWSCYSN